MIIPGTTKLTFNITLAGKDVNITLAGNLGRNIIRKLVVKLEGNEIVSIDNYNILYSYYDCWKTASLIGNSDQTVNSKFITFYGTYSGLGLLISKAQSGSYVAIANDGSSSIKPDLKFPSLKSNCTIFNKWHVISVTWSKGENLSNCWSYGVKLKMFTMGNVKGTNHCYIGNYLIIPHSQPSSTISRWFKTHLTGYIGEIIGFYRSLTDGETSHIHKYLMRKWEI